MSGNDDAADDNEWTSKRREVTYQEARAVLDGQQTALIDIDSKAMRTVRITVILIGILVSATQLAGVSFNSILALLGGVALVASLATGIFTYQESDPYLGPSREYIVQLTEGDFEETTWEADLLKTMGGFIESNSDDIRFNGILLLVAQACLFVGVLLIALAVVT